MRPGDDRQAVGVTRADEVDLHAAWRADASQQRPGSVDLAPGADRCRYPLLLP
jgi:hypothetical protein